MQALLVFECCILIRTCSVDQPTTEEVCLNTLNTEETFQPCWEGLQCGSCWPAFQFSYVIQR